MSSAEPAPKPLPSADPPRGMVSLSLRVKIIIAFIAISSLVSLALGLSTYAMLNRSLHRELQNRVSDLTTLGSELLDRGALRRLSGRLSGEPEEVERSEDYRLVSQQLNLIRGTSPDLVRYVYTFVSTADENTALFLVDADVLELLQAREAGEEVIEAELSRFGSEFDLGEFPVARQALRERISLVETEYTYDEEFGVNSVSGYAPVLDEDGQTLLAVLGLDMVDADARALLRRTTLNSVAIAGVALLVALGTSIFFGAYFTRGIITLDRVVRGFSEMQLDIRAEIRSRDEVGRLGTSFNRMAETIQRYSHQLDSLLRSYGRFVPHDFLRFLKKQSIIDVRLGDQVQEEMTILFSDIRSFTELSESMSPEENFNFLNSFLSRIGPEIRGHHGFIDKYIGDAVMALFPERPDDAVRAAVAMQTRLKEYNGHRQSSGYQPISVGVGIHTGTLMLGTLGEEERMDGSVISDAVNLCSRLESLTRLYGGTILVTGYTLSQLENRREFRHRFLDRVRVRGRKESVLIYEIFEGDPPELLQWKTDTRPEWTRAMNYYYDRQFARAYKILQTLRRADDPDPSVELYLKRCARLILRGVPEGWQGVEVIDVK